MMPGMADLAAAVVAMEALVENAPDAERQRRREMLAALRLQLTEMVLYEGEMAIISRQQRERERGMIA